MVSGSAFDPRAGSCLRFPALSGLELLMPLLAFIWRWLQAGARRSCISDGLGRRPRSAAFLARRLGHCLKES